MFYWGDYTCAENHTLSIFLAKRHGAGYPAARCELRPGGPGVRAWELRAGVRAASLRHPRVGAPRRCPSSDARERAPAGGQANSHGLTVTAHGICRGERWKWCGSPNDVKPCLILHIHVVSKVLLAWVVKFSNILIKFSPTSHPIVSKIFS